VSKNSQFVLYYRGSTIPPEDDRARIRATPGLRVIDEASPRLLLVECRNLELQKTLRDLRGWSIEPEYPVRVGKG
jgi:hypothetical protein